MSQNYEENFDQEGRFEGYEEITFLEGVASSEGSEGEDQQEDVELPAFDPELVPAVPSPPVVAQPLYSCSEAIIIIGVVKGAEVLLDIDGDEHVRMARNGAVVFEVSPLKEGARVRAKQSYDGKASAWSFPATVAPHPRRLPTPLIVDHPYKCAGFVVAENLFVGARARCIVNGTDGRAVVVRGERQTIPAPQALDAGDVVQVLVTFCEEADDELLEAISEERKALTDPSPMPVSVIPKNKIILGNDHIVVRDVLVGAHGTLRNTATGSDLFFWNLWESAWHGVLRKPIEAGDAFTFENRLCQAGRPSDPVEIKEGDPELGILPAPVLARPICPGDVIFTVYGCVPGARVGLLVDGRPVAIAVAHASTVQLAVDPAAPVRSGQKVAAFTYVRPGDAKISSEIEVMFDNTVSITISGAINYTNPDGDVRYGIDVRQSSLIFFKVQSCCDNVEDPGPQATIERGERPFALPAQLYPAGENCWAGYILLEEELPPGPYQLRVSNLCEGREQEKEFWVHRRTPGERDGEAPTLELTVETSDGARVRLTDRDRQPVKIAAWFDERLGAQLDVRDGSGLQAAAVTKSGSIRARTTGLTNYGYRGEVPVPTDLLMRSTWVPEDLGSMFLDAAAVDLTIFAQGSQTPQIEVDVDQRTPIFTKVQPTSGRPGTPLTLTGDHLAIRPQTMMLFHQGGVEKARVDVTAKAQKTTISSVNVPQLSPGRYEISIETGPQPKRSLGLPFTLNPAPEPEPEQPKTKTIGLEFMKVTVFEGFDLGGRIFFAMDRLSLNYLSVAGQYPFVGEPRSLTSSDTPSAASRHEHMGQ